VSSLQLTIVCPNSYLSEHVKLTLADMSTFLRRTLCKFNVNQHWSRLTVSLARPVHIVYTKLECVTNY